MKWSKSKNTLPALHRPVIVRHIQSGKSMTDKYVGHGTRWEKGHGWGYEETEWQYIETSKPTKL